MKKTLFLMIGLCLNIALFASDAPRGKQLFMTNCSSCHAVAKEVVGPALMDVDKRRSEAWIISFVHASQKVIQSGDTAGVRLFELHNHTVMPDHPGLSDDDIKNIIAFIREDGARIKSLPAVAVSSDDSKPYLGKSSFLHQLIFLDVDGVQRPLSFSNIGAWVLILMSIAVLILVLYLAVSVEGLKAGNDNRQEKK